MDAAGFPVTLKHPQHAAAVLSNSTVANNGGALPVTHGRPERFPDVIVHDAKQEAMYRAQGYLRFGESAPVYDAHLEYPKILCHADYQEAVLPTQSPVVNPSGQVSFVTIPGTPAKFPHVTVSSREEEDKWAEKGYFPAGHFDVAAYEKAVDAPGEAGDEWPKWVDGVLMDDPEKPVDESRLYPMMVYAEDGTVLGTAANRAEVEKLKARGSTKNEPVVKKAVESGYDADYAEFLEWRRWKAQREAKSQIPGFEPDVGMLRPAEENVSRETLPQASDPVAEDGDLIQTLRKEAAELGIEVDGRWSERTLRREIDAALSR